MCRKPIHTWTRQNYPALQSSLWPVVVRTIVFGTSLLGGKALLRTNVRRLPLQRGSDSKVEACWNCSSFGNDLPECILCKKETGVTVALYPSIHLEEAFRLLEGKIRQHPEKKEKTDLEPDELLELAKLCAENPYTLGQGRTTQRSNRASGQW